jgi:hypothetical protein
VSLFERSIKDVENVIYVSCSSIQRWLSSMFRMDLFCDVAENGALQVPLRFFHSDGSDQLLRIPESVREIGCGPGFTFGAADHAAGKCFAHFGFAFVANHGDELVFF